MKVEIITIGDEILIGQIIDTNSAWMAQELNLIGANIERIVTLTDTVDEIIGALTDAEKRSDLVLITGGLGPTKDDKTKIALAQYFNCELEFYPEIEEHISQLFHRLGKEMTYLNRLQAQLPTACQALKNELGTAPGMWFEKNQTIFVSMPGVPYEMKGLMQQHILPRIKERFTLPAILHKTVLTMGLGESWLSERIEAWENALPPQLRLAYLPSPGRVRLRLSAFGQNKKKLQRILDQEVNKLVALIPELVFGYDTDTIESVVGDLLRQQGKTISTAESCTGGLIAHKLTSIAGASDYFLGSVIAYSNQVKMATLGVEKSVLETHGAVSSQVVEQMATGCLKVLRTDYAIAVSGIAGPTGGSQQKPVGTVWIAIASPEGVKSKRFSFGHNRQRNIEISANTALNLLRNSLLNSSQL